MYICIVAHRGSRGYHISCPYLRHIPVADLPRDHHLLFFFLLYRHVLQLDRTTHSQSHTILGLHIPARAHTPQLQVNQKRIIIGSSFATHPVTHLTRWVVHKSLLLSHRSPAPIINYVELYQTVNRQWNATEQLSQISYPICVWRGTAARTSPTHH